MFLCFTRATSLVLGFVVLCFACFLFVIVDCEYQCNQLAGQTSLRNYVLRVKWNIKPYILTHSLSMISNYPHSQILLYFVLQSSSSALLHYCMSIHLPCIEGVQQSFLRGNCHKQATHGL